MKTEIVTAIVELSRCPHDKNMENRTCFGCRYNYLDNCSVMLEKNAIVILDKAFSNLKFESGLCECGKDASLERKISSTLQDLGVPAHINGHKYLVFAICLTVEHPEVLNNIIGELYSVVATKFGVTYSKVERSIRFAIETAWSRGDNEVQYSIFGSSVDPEKGKPTNKQFISTLSNLFRGDFQRAGGEN